MGGGELEHDSCDSLYDSLVTAYLVGGGELEEGGQGEGADEDAED